MSAQLFFSLFNKLLLKHSTSKHGKKSLLKSAILERNQMQQSVDIHIFRYSKF